jgi:hypothetical protein
MSVLVTGVTGFLGGHPLRTNIACDESPRAHVAARQPWRVGGSRIISLCAAFAAIDPLAVSAHAGHGPPVVYVGHELFQPTPVNIFVGESVIWLRSTS